jgi:GNAT superfamily N-acetyltransferase
VTDIEIRATRYLAPVAQALAAAAIDELATRYGGPGDDTPIEAMEFDPPEGGFFVAWRAGEPVGCAGWRTHPPDRDTAELKRMYVSESARGAGVATALLSAVEDSAVEQGRRRLILECGDRQPEAIALYEKVGYIRISDFGHYKDAPGVRSYGRDLAARRIA